METHKADVPELNLCDQCHNQNLNVISYSVDIQLTILILSYTPIAPYGLPFIHPTAPTSHTHNVISSDSNAMVSIRLPFYLCYFYRGGGAPPNPPATNWGGGLPFDSVCTVCRGKGQQTEPHRAYCVL